MPRVRRSASARWTPYVFAILCCSLSVCSYADAEDPATVGAITASAPSSATSTSLQTLLASSPPSAAPWAPSLIRAMEAFRAEQDAQKSLKALRIDQDSVKTELVSVNGTLELVTRERQELETKLRALEAKRQDRVSAMRKELEDRLQKEIALARAQIQKEQDQEFARSAQAFEARQTQLIEQSLDQDIELQEREIDHLTKELEALTSELRDRLAKLQPGSELAQSVESTIGKSVAQRRAEIKARRDQLRVQRDALVQKRRIEFTDRLKRQQAAEMQTRLVYKEASLRQAMAELLQKAQVQEEGAVGQTRQMLDDAKARQMQAAKRQALLSTRLQELDQQVLDASRRIALQETARGESLARLEQTFQQDTTNTDAKNLAWFRQVIQRAPSEFATELGSIYQRLFSKAEKQRQTREQEKLLRERQLAMQVSREMERRYQEAQDQRQRDQLAMARKVDDLLARARELQKDGRYDDALRLMAQVQAINPSQASQIGLIQQDIETAKEQSVRQAKSSQAERLFNQAMQAFDKGKYEEAITLFQQVISFEAQAGAPVR